MSFTLSQHVIGCSLLMSHLNSGSKPELTEKVDDQHHGTNKASLDWFCQLETNHATLSLFNYHHGTGPKCLRDYHRNIM